MANEISLEAAIAAGIAAAQQLATVPPAKSNTDWTSIDTPLDHEGKRIVLPAEPDKMSIRDGITTLQRYEKDESQTYQVRELVVGLPFDAAVAVYKALTRIYGVISPQTTRTFFGPQPPEFMTVKTGPDPRDVVQIPMGKMRLPNVENDIYVSLDGEGCVIFGTVTKKERALLVNIGVLAREILRKESVYRGRAIRLPMDGAHIGGEPPEFIDLANVSEDDMVHTRETEMMVRMNIISPLKNTQACRDHKIPLKRGILLSGFYGTGKSLTARVAAKVGTDNGWTFFLIDDPMGLAAVIEVAKLYQPCIIFAEDMDRAADRSKKNVNHIVNMLDGLISKDMEMMVVLTTNFIERIDKSLLRPGRFDAIVQIDVPDEETVGRLIRKYAGQFLPEEADISNVTRRLNGNIPAIIREVVERSKLFMLEGGRNTMQAEDIEAAAIGIQRHIDLLNAKPDAPSKAEQLWNNLHECMVPQAGSRDSSHIADLTGTVDEMWSHVSGRVTDYLEEINAQTGAIRRDIKMAAAAAKDENKTKKTAR